MRIAWYISFKALPSTCSQHAATTGVTDDPECMPMTRHPRPRIAAMWRAALRRGRVRNETTLLLQRSPVMHERLRGAHEQLPTWGVVPEWPHVQQPFDYLSR